MDEHVVHGAAEAAEDHQYDHLQAQDQDQVQVADAAVVESQHAVVHDAAHELRLDQVHHHLAHHKDCRENGVM